MPIWKRCISAMARQPGMNCLIRSSLNSVTRRKLLPHSIGSSGTPPVPRGSPRLRSLGRGVPGQPGAHRDTLKNGPDGANRIHRGRRRGQPLGQQARALLPAVERLHKGPRGVFGASPTLPGMDGPEHHKMRRSPRGAHSRAALAQRLSELIGHCREGIGLWKEGGLPKSMMLTPKTRRARKCVSTLQDSIHPSHRPAQRQGKPQDLADALLELHRSDPQFLPETDIVFPFVASMVASIYLGSSLGFAVYAMVRHPDSHEAVRREALPFIRPATASTCGNSGQAGRTRRAPPCPPRRNGCRLRSPAHARSPR